MILSVSSAMGIHASIRWWGFHKHCYLKAVLILTLLNMMKDLSFYPLFKHWCSSWCFMWRCRDPDYSSYPMALRSSLVSDMPSDRMWKETMLKTLIGAMFKMVLLFLSAVTEGVTTQEGDVRALPHLCPLGDRPLARASIPYVLFKNVLSPLFCKLKYLPRSEQDQVMTSARCSSS